MDAMRSLLRHPMGMDDADEEDAAQEVEMSFPQSDGGPAAEPGSDITALLLRYRRGNRKRACCLCVCGALIFTTAFLLGFVAFRGSHNLPVPARDEAEGLGLYRAVGKTGVLYLGELRQMLHKYLDNQDIESTVRRVSRSSHVPGSAEGVSLASEVRQTFQKLQMDRSWTRSVHATLSFPDSQESALWLVDSGERILEQFPLNMLDYCPYSASGTVTGDVIYANYGRAEDFDWLRSMGVSLTGCVAVMRVGGGLSFAEKIRLAESHGAGGALIYPDPADIPQDPRRLGLSMHTAVSDHVHLGSGDPLTPGFPSTIHTLFPPIKSSGLPRIPVLPISASNAAKLLSQLSGPLCPRSWQGRLPYVRCVVGPTLSPGNGRKVKMAVYNTMKPVRLTNIFATLQGKVEPDQYIIVGAQRDSRGPGAVKSGVGTAILLELARTFSTMVKNGFSPKRSLLFASWDAGDFGHIGTTEWVEGYLSMLHLKAVAYFSLDQAVTGDDFLSAHTSPLLADLLNSAIRQVEHPKHAGQTIYSQTEREGGSWKIVKPLDASSAAFVFTALAGVPAMELRFSRKKAYPFVNTPLDNTARLQEVLGGRLGVTGRSIAELVGQMMLRLAHNHILPLRITSYAETVLEFSTQLNKHTAQLQDAGISTHWLFSARGNFVRAAVTLKNFIDNSDTEDAVTKQYYNTCIMRVEHYFLSQYVSAADAPFRHVIHGRGEHTLSALRERLALLTSDPERFDPVRFRRQLALFTWTLQSAANALEGTF